MNEPTRWVGQPYTALSLIGGSVEYVRIDKDGSILINGKPPENDGEIADALRKFAREYTKDE